MAAFITNIEVAVRFVSCELKCDFILKPTSEEEGWLAFERDIHLS